METKVEICSLTDVGLIREKNEDSLGLSELSNGQVFVVCDGMGGHVGGQIASQTAVDSIIAYLQQHSDILPNALTQAILYANEQVRSTATQNPELHNMGTTATVLVLQNNQAYYAHVGDSRIYLYSNTILHQLTKDHSVVQALLDQGIITEAEAARHPRRNEILQALGVTKDVIPQLCKEPALPSQDDIFMLCSDGLCGLINDLTMQEVLNDDSLNLQQKGQKLIRLAKEAGGYDNITVQLIQIIASPNTKSQFVSINKPTHNLETTQQTTNNIQTSSEQTQEQEIKYQPESLHHNNDTDDSEQDIVFDKRNFLQKHKNQILIAIIIVALMSILFKIFINNSQTYALIFYKNNVIQDIIFINNKDSIDSRISLYFSLHSTNITTNDIYEAKAWVTDSKHNIDTKTVPLVNRTKRLTDTNTSSWASYIFRAGRRFDTLNITYHQTLNEAIKYVSHYLNYIANPSFSYQGEVWQRDANGTFGKSGSPKWETGRPAIAVDTGKTLTIDTLQNSQAVDSTKNNELKQENTERNNTTTDSKPKGESPKTLQHLNTEIPLDTILQDIKWQDLYSKWQVCPCFIKEVNDASLFDSMGEPIIGSVLVIPVKYSGLKQFHSNNTYLHFHPDSMGWDSKTGKCLKLDENCYKK